MAYVDFILKLHRGTRRDYLERVVKHDKAACSEVAVRYGQEYWDGDRRFGYGGYRYDGRWKVVADEMAKHYALKSGAAILDVGCGKGFLLHEFRQVVPGARLAGIDISRYALQHAKDEVRSRLAASDATHLPFPDRSFDFVVSITTLHNLYNYQLWDAVREIERVARGPKHIVIESYRNEREKANLLYWQLTCRSFYTPREWEWFFEKCGYTGDYSYIVFE